MTDQQDELRPRQEHYLDNTTWVMKWLRFFNLLEPGRAVLSVSKMMMWVSFFLLVYVSLFHYGDIYKMMGAIGTFVGAVGNYAWRRQKQQ